MTAAATASAEIVEKAADGDIHIWGVHSLNERHGKEPIPDVFWKYYQIDLEVLLSAPPEKTKTEPSVPLSRFETYYALMVSRLQVEKLWPPGKLSL